MLIVLKIFQPSHNLINSFKKMRTAAQSNNLIFVAAIALTSLFTTNAQYYTPNIGGVGCVVTGNKLYSHGNYIRDLSESETVEMEKYKRDLVEFRQKVDEAYANLEQLMRKNATLPQIPNRPQMPAFCTSNETTLYILGGCTVQNHKVYVGGKFARELNPKEKIQLNEFAKQMIAANMAAFASATASPNATAAMHQYPSTTTISPVSEAGKQIALDFCTEF